ncbi:MAG: hypothetical protein PHX08_16945 [Lachnospiraceae bacterium]|nr:hypothetical protein [Lachnospiraceae bacterium]
MGNTLQYVDFRETVLSVNKERTDAEIKYAEKGDYGIFLYSDLNEISGNHGVYVRIMHGEEFLDDTYIHMGSVFCETEIEAAFKLTKDTIEEAMQEKE